VLPRGADTGEVNVSLPAESRTCIPINVESAESESEIGFFFFFFSPLAAVFFCPPFLPASKFGNIV
jgi:hypothetical protein